MVHRIGVMWIGNYIEQLSIDWCLAAVRICGRSVLCTGVEEMECT
jgi:hypothetical protein